MNQVCNIQQLVGYVISELIFFYIESIFPCKNLLLVQLDICYCLFGKSLLFWMAFFFLFVFHFLNLDLDSQFCSHFLPIFKTLLFHWECHENLLELEWGLHLIFLFKKKEKKIHSPCSRNDIFWGLNRCLLMLFEEKAYYCELTRFFSWWLNVLNASF